MRSLTIFLFALVLMVLGVHASPEHPNQRQQGVDTSCDETKSSTTVKNVEGGVGSTTLLSTTGATTGIPAPTSTSPSTSLTSTITVTITSTRTNTVTVTSPPPSGSCALSSATTGIPITTSPVVPTANNKTLFALDTTTSTKHLTNVTNSTPPATTAPNATVPKPTISPPISGFQGAAAALSSRSPASVFALGCLVFMAALMA